MWEFLILGRSDVMVTGHHRHSLSGTTFGTSCNSWGCPDGFSTFVIQSQLYLFSIAILQSDNGILQEELCQRSDRLHFIPDTLLLVTSADAGWRRCSCPCCPEFTRRHRGSVTLVSDDDFKSIQLITSFCLWMLFQIVSISYPSCSVSRRANWSALTATIQPKNFVKGRPKLPPSSSRR